MNREQKAAVIEDLQARFSEAPLVILSEYVGSTVPQLDAVRRACEPVGASFQVVKNTLARRALEGTDKVNLLEHFQGNVAVIISGDDPAAAAKIYRDQAKDNKLLTAKVGFFDGDIVKGKDVVGLADLPSREELLVKLLQTLLAGPRQVMGVIRAPARDLLYLLTNYATKLESEQNG
jgi:large subunit ribosomal protein L10